MNPLPNFNRKLIYGMIIVLLFGVMFPYTNWLTGEKKRRDLGEAAIGQIDTGGFMMKLFLLGGFRGIVADILWMRAEEQKKDHDWDRLKSTVELITKLQPHFLAIWTFQGWNLAYNVSVEWDAPDDKYVWIKEGIKFLQEGVNKNRRSPDLIWDTAWTYYHKLGFSDESIILRRLFYDDEDLPFKTYEDKKTHQPVESKDNFKLGYGWFTRAVTMVDEGANRLGGGTASEIRYVDATPQRKGRADDIAFRSMPSHAQTRYAAGLEKMSVYGIEATFGDIAKNEWFAAYNEWFEFGNHVYMSFNQVERNGKMVRDEIRLNDICDPVKLKAMPENQRHWTGRWAEQMNFRYWRERAAAESTTDAVRARQLFYEGTKAYKTGDFTTAADRFRRGLDVWKVVMDDHPAYRDDELSKKDTGQIVYRYARVLRQNLQPLPDDLPFKDYIKLVENDPTKDPFDTLEMIGVVPTNQPVRPAAAEPTAAEPARGPAGAAVPTKEEDKKKKKEEEDKKKKKEEEDKKKKKEEEDKQSKNRGPAGAEVPTVPGSGGK